jgi:hypothetical protein
LSWKVTDWLQNETSLFAQSAAFSDDVLPGIAKGVTGAARFGRLVRRWARGRLRGGVPASLAIQNNRNSRFALLRKMRLNRQRWSLQTDLSPEFYLGAAI